MSFLYFQHNLIIISAYSRQIYFFKQLSCISAFKSRVLWVEVMEISFSRESENYYLYLLYNFCCAILTTKEGGSMKTKEKKPVFGPFLKEQRTLKRITLREFCKLANAADPGNISKLERGIWPPPQDREILERYAKALKIEKASDDWFKFFDLAAVDRGIIPQDIMSDAEVVKMLPVFFRTLRVA